MKFQFSNASLLWLLPCAAAYWFCFSTRIGMRLRAFIFGSAATQLKTPLPARALHGIAALCLILAADGLQYRNASRKIQCVVAVDVSPSIFELNAQTARVRELLGALDPETSEVAFAVFSETAGLERAMTPLSALLSSDASPGHSKQWPDFSRLNSVVKTDGTDIGGALLAARGAFTSNDGARGILLLSDFRDTHAPNARGLHGVNGAAYLLGTGIDLLATPAILGPSSDVQLAEFRAPESAAVGRAVPLEITLAAQQPATVVVGVRRSVPGKTAAFVDSKTVTLDAPRGGSRSSGELRKTVRLFDHPAVPGVAVYTASITGPDGPIPGDVLLNNSLSAAVPISGSSKWAVLTRPNSTLAKLAADPARPLGVETRVFLTGNLPGEAAEYEPFAGILVDGLSADELPEGGRALLALSLAADGGKALAALGGEAAFGAGGHPRDGAWEKILPVEMTPEDDRARAVLFLIDVSQSMNDPMLNAGVRVRKMDFAAQQLQAVTRLRPQDRLGLIEFSGGAKLASKLSNEPTRSAFLNAIHDIRIEAKTDFLPALELAKETLDADDAEKKLVLLISDGVDTSGRPRDDVLRAAEKLCPKSDGNLPRRTTLLTFGIDVGSEVANATGEILLQDLAATGGGTYFADFSKLGERLEKEIDSDKKEFYTRNDAFVPQAAQPHDLIQNGGAWPVLNFRNRVKAKSGTDTLLVSSASAGSDKKSRADPLLVLSGPNSSGLGRRAVLALTLDGEQGAKLLAADSAGRSLLGRLLIWAEARGERGTNGVAILAEPFGNDELSLELRAFDPATGEPDNALDPQAILTPLQTAGNDIAADAPTRDIALRPVAPGTYRAALRAPSAAVCRLSVRDGGRTLAERFVSTPCPAEMRRFGVDRAAMAEWLAQAGPNARAIESPRDLAQWAAEKSGITGWSDVRGWLLAFALAALLFEYGLRVKRSSL